MRTIGIDCRFATTSSGIGRYTRDVVTALLKRGGAQYALIVRSASETWLPASSTASFTVIESPIAHYTVAEQFRLPLILRRARLDLYFCPHFNVPLACGIPTVITVHDLILHRFPNHAHILKRMAYRTVLRSALAKARRVIAVSAFTAGELAARYPPSIRDKVRVIHEAAGTEFAPASPERVVEVRRRYGLEQSYFLYVGNAKEHKNVQTLIDAFALLGDPQCELVLVTGGSEAAHLRLVPGVSLLRGVPHEDLPALYSGARCFVSASLYEGFGLPLVESHACECPAIVTHCGSFPEIAPPGTVLVEPTAAALASAMRSPPRWLPSAHRRTWDDVAAETYEVFGREEM